GDRQSGALQQELPRQQRPVQLALGERPFGDRRSLRRHAEASISCVRLNQLLGSGRAAWRHAGGGAVR
ncbi:MAG: hypothetical protein ACXWXP_09190, partial [Actinomycetota bacterium]